ncbi:MAG TPA: hypothetical protein VGY56_05185 [Verrucomicrobiae bacterium]|nr:hypothetical protein [Verrucomicrobiae bacterium]
MDLKSVISGVAVSLAGLFGCHKAATPAATAPSSAQSSVKDLGVLQMTNNYETCVFVGDGKDCRLVPKILDKKNIQITVTFESKKADGKPTGFSVVELQGAANKPFEVSFGTNTDFTFTPQIAAN